MKYQIKLNLLAKHFQHLSALFTAMILDSVENICTLGRPFEWRKVV